VTKREMVDFYLTKAADCERRGKKMAALWYFERALEAEGR
jgi:hypothetical protein